jgi:peptidoglycan/xylan/chitin deacetylase (PgdA/CDA1 family)
MYELSIRGIIYLFSYLGGVESMRKILIVIFSMLFIIFLCAYAYTYNAEQKEMQVKEKIDNIKSHYNQYVKTTDVVKLYKIVDSNYVESGELSKDNELELSEINIDVNTQYFNIKDTDYYVSYEKLTHIDALSSISQRYKKYIPFNENIKTKDNTTFYLDDNIYVTYNESYDLPIIIKDTDKYGVEFDNKLYYVKADDVTQLYNHQNTTITPKKKIRTLTYHFLYDPEESSCNEEICLTTNKLEEQLEYLKDNDYLTLRLPELEMFLDGKINLPQNSVVLTIDDGTVVSKKAISLFEQYQEYATVFVVTSFVKDLTVLKSDYLDLESHSDNMHNQYECPGMGLQGGAILCKDEDYILKDLKTCQDKLGGSVYFAYPFFDFNERAINILKKAGYHMAFVGQYNTEGLSWPGTNKFIVPRMTILNSTTIDEFKDLVK